MYIYSLVLVEARIKIQIWNIIIRKVKQDRIKTVCVSVSYYKTK